MEGIPLPYHRQRVAASLRAARKRREMTQHALSKASGVSQQFISIIERGKASVTVDTLASLAEALQVPIETFLARDQE